MKNSNSKVQVIYCDYIYGVHFDKQKQVRDQVTHVTLHIFFIGVAGLSSALAQNTVRAMYIQCLQVEGGSKEYITRGTKPCHRQEKGVVLSSFYHDSWPLSRL